MPTTLQFRRYDTANIANTTGAVGEIFIDTDKDTVVVNDGSTSGGFPLALEANTTAAHNQANSARLQANNAYAEANLKLNLAGGTISGDLVVSGNLAVQGNTTTLNVEVLHIEDNEILLNSGVTGAPTLNAGIVINRGTGPSSYLKWVEGANTWGWSDDGAIYITFANLHQSIIYSNAAFSTLNNTFDHANSQTANVYAQANIARDQANSARAQANTAYGHANNIYDHANNSYNQANAGYAQANAGYAQANAAYADSNTRVLKAGDTMTGNLNVSAWLITQNIVPNANVTYDIGSNELRFKDIWVSNSTIHVGDADISSVGDEIRIPKLNVEILSSASGINVAAQSSDAYSQANTARGTANDAYAQANAGITIGENAYAQANTARDTANGAYAQSNGAYAQANGAYGQANGAYGQANTGIETANGAYAQANGAYGQANGAYGSANGAYAQANGAYGQANGAYAQANGAYDAANNAKVTVFANSGAANVTTQVINFVNTSTLLVTVANTGGNANVTLDLVGTPYDQANTARDTANGAYAQANGAYGQANGAYAQANGATDVANGAYAQANGAYAQANGAYGSANGAYAQANIAYGQANDAYAQANSARLQANDAYAQANSARLQANDAYAQANSARLQANNAYAEANLKLNLTGGTISGSLNVSGNLSITGNTTYYNVSTYVVDDPLLYIAANNETSDLVDIGFMGGKNTAGQYSHTGLARHAGDGVWYLFDNLAEEGHQNNVVDVANTTYAMLRANIEAQSINVGTVPVANTNHANGAYNTANGAYGQANGAYAQANGAYGQANGAYGQANIAYGQANAAYDAANNAKVTVYANSDSGVTTQAINFVNTSSVLVAVANSGGNSNVSVTLAGTPYDQANAARSQANAAYADSNTRVSKSGDTISGQLTIDTSGFALTANVADGNDAARFKSPTRTLAITPYYNSEGNDYGTWFEAFTTSGGSYSKMTLMGSDIILNSQGNTGIAVLSPTSKLHVSGNANITSGLVVDGSTLVVDATNNRVGVGIATPSTPLEVVADGSSGLGITIRSMPDEFGSLRFRSNNGSTTFGELAVDYGGSIYLASVTNLPLKLKTNNTDRVHIDATGNVGVGTTSPTSNLHVAGNANITGQITNAGGINTNGLLASTLQANTATITLGPGSTDGFSSIVRIQSNTRTMRIYPYYNSEGSNRGTWFTVFDTNTLNYSKFTLSAGDIVLDATGNVGISTNSPTSNLHVIGNANITTTMVVGGLTTTANIVEKTVANTNTNGANNINLNESNFFTRTLTANCQFTFRNAPASGNAQNFTLVVIQDASGARVPSWANTIYWAGGSAPPATTTANARDVWQFVTYDGGSTYFGTLAIKAAS